MIEPVPSRNFAIAALGLVACLAAASAFAGLAGPHQSSCKELQMLKYRYLQCEHAAQSGRLQKEGVAYCSKVYYDLKARAFGDDFGKIRAWYDLMVAVHGLDAYAAATSEHVTKSRRCE